MRLGCGSLSLPVSLPLSDRNQTSGAGGPLGRGMKKGAAVVVVEPAALLRLLLLVLLLLPPPLLWLF